MPVVQQSPRRSRRISASDDEALVSSQIGRRAKILSTEVKSQSPAPKRRTRASSAEPSDDEAVVFVSESIPVSRTARMKQRQSVILSPTVEQITEDDELNISNELELRNRSISKSPASVYLSPKGNSYLGMKNCSVLVSKCSTDDTDLVENNLKADSESPNESNQEEIFAVSANNEEDILPLSQFVKNKIMEVEPSMSPSQITRKKRLSMAETQKIADKEVQERLPKSTNDIKDKSLSGFVNGKSVDSSTFSPELFSENDDEFQQGEQVNLIIDRITSPKPSTPKSKTSTPATNGTPSGLLKPINSEDSLESSEPTSSLSIQGRRSYREKSLAGNEQSFSEIEGSPVRKNKSLITLDASPLINFNTPIKNVVQAIAVEKEKTPLNKKTPMKVVEVNPVKSVSTPMKISSSEKTPGKDKMNESKSMDISKDNNSDMDITLVSLKKKAISKTPQPMKVETVSKTLSKSWSQAIEANSSEQIVAIDSFSTTLETKSVIKTKTPSKLIDTDTEGEEGDEDEDEDLEQKERSELVLDEAEEGEDDSMDSSERNYVKENEIVEEGEDLGSEDTDGDELDEEDEEDSFIASDNPDIDQYSLDSDEEVIELRKSRNVKRQSRIIVNSDSSEDEIVLEKTPVKTPRKSLTNKSPEKVVEKEDNRSKKRKREDKMDDSVIVNTKRAKFNETILDATDDSYESSMSDYEDALEKSVELDADTTLKTPSKKQKEKTPKKSAKKETPMEVEEESSEEMQQDNEITQKKIKVKKAKPTVADMDTIINKCNSILSKSEQEKKANKALKKIRKMEEKRLKLSLKASTDSANTSTENKENTLKKKKYKKNMKQKAVEDVIDYKKEDMATSLSKFSEKMERKRLRKAEKKLEKKVQMELNAGTEELNVEVAVPVVKADKKV